MVKEANKKPLQLQLSAVFAAHALGITSFIYIFPFFFIISFLFPLFPSFPLPPFFGVDILIHVPFCHPF